MSQLDPELLRQLVVTFQAELDERLQVIITGLLALEKGISDTDEKLKMIESIFRSAHNIKGSARGIGITDIGEIAHGLESIFSEIQKTKADVPTAVINDALQAVDKMREAMQTFLKKPASQGSEDQLESIRVEIEKLDKLSTLVEEMQVNKISIDDHYSEVTEMSAKSEQFHKLWQKLQGTLNEQLKVNQNDRLKHLILSGNDCFSELNQLTKTLNKSMRSQANEFSTLANSIQEEVRMLRLIPASHILHTMPRYVRDLCAQLKKEIDLTIIGEDIKIDKLVLDGLKDPLMHLIRNAIDHGIESPEARKELGKPSKGHIQILLKDEGSLISISIADDGAGIDINKIIQKLKQKGLFTDAEIEKMSQEEILELIFQSGFSTKEILTNISGRGVGLDVVRANIVALKGQLSFKTEPKLGTEFIIHVPLTLSSERGLLVKSMNQLFVIPTQSIDCVLTLKPEEVHEVEGNQVLLQANHPVPLHALVEVLQLEKIEALSQAKLFVIVIKSGINPVGFLVDEIIGEREIVIKALQQPLTHLPCVAGATLLERNQIVIVLNSNELVATALRLKSVNRIKQENSVVPTTERPHILVVDDSITTRTLEKSILENNNYQVTVAVNGKEALDLLQKQKFSLLITDVTMPIMDGFTLTEQVKKNNQLNYLPVIIVTSLGSDAEKARGIEVGADAYIVKNEFESGALLDIVAQLV